MAYGVLYEFHRTSTNGADMLITISQKGYSGAVKKRALGRAPVIKRDNNGHIYGTSCELYAECLVDGEFSHLYTSDAYEYKVEVYKNNTLLWAGFVSPELYSEPDIAPPYDIQIIATDGLGELKNYNFNKRGAAFILDHINALMANTGIDMGFNVVSGLRYIDENGAASADKDILSVKLDLDHEEGNSCYEVLQGILSSLNANITQHNGSYLIFRETDFITKAGAQGVEAFNVSGNKINLGIASFGTIKENQWWPVGQLSTVIEPAKNQIVLTSPNHYKGNVLRFDNWTTSEMASFSEAENAYVLPGADSYITQTIDFGGHQVGYRLGLRVRARNVGTPTEEEQNIGLKIEMEGQTSAVGPNYWLVKPATGGRRPASGYMWRNTEGSFEEDLTTPSEAEDASDAQDIDIVLPLYRDSARAFAYAKRIKLTIFNPKGLYNIHVYDVSLVKYEQIKGYEANVTIDNMAREAESDVDLTITAGDLAPTAGNVFMTGLPLRPSDSEVITKWQIGNNASQDYLAAMAFDYSRGISLPRMKYSGILNVPGSSTVLPTLFLRDGTYYFPHTYSYDLYYDEITVELISISAADVSLSSVAISQTTEAVGTMGATTGGTSGGGGAVSIPRDKQMSDTSDNAVENKVIKKYVDDVFAPIGKWFSEISPMFGKMADGILKVSGNLVITGDTSSGGGAGGGQTQITGFLNDLKDVTIKSQVTGDLLVYNGIEWVNTPQSSIVPNLTGYATQEWVLGKNYLAGIDSAMVTNALGYTPFSSAGGELNDYVTFNNSVGKTAGIIFKDNRIGSSGYADNILTIKDSSDTTYGTLGLFGDSEGLKYFYFGHNSYNGNNLRIYKDKVTWADQTILHANNYSLYALPLSGGELKVTSADAFKINRTNGNPFVSFFNETNILGRIGFSTETSQPIAVVMGVSQTLLHSGNYSDYALPLTGGTLKAEGSDIFVINRLNSTSPTTITYKKDGGLLGRMGFDASTKEPVAQVSGSYQTLIHSGNIGSYASLIGAYPTSAGSYNYAFASGIYTANGAEENLPISEAGNIVLNAKYDSKASAQLYLRTSSDALYYRRKRSGTWYDWKTVAFTDSTVAAAHKLVTSSGAGAVIVNSSGNVGIGTTNPAYKLDVNGNAKISNELLLTNPTGLRWAYGDYGVLFRNDNLDYYILLTNAGEAVTGSWNALRPLKINLATGNVTIGHELKVSGLTQISAELGCNNRFVCFAPYEVSNGVSFGFMKAGVANQNNIGMLHIGTNYGGSSTITNYGVDMTAISIYRGVVGIGKEYDYASIRAVYNKGAKLGVDGGIYVTGSAEITGATTISSTLNVSGAVTINNNLLLKGEVASASDMRLKDVIEERILNIEDIANAPYFSYRWKNSEYGHTHLGTSAQYWKEIAAEYVVDGDIMTLNYASLGVGIGISLAKKTLDLEARVKVLEKENKRLKKQINGIR